MSCVTANTHLAFPILFSSLKNLKQICSYYAFFDEGYLFGCVFSPFTALPIVYETPSIYIAL